MGKRKRLENGRQKRELRSLWSFRIPSFHRQESVEILPTRQPFRRKLTQDFVPTDGVGGRRDGEDGGEEEKGGRGRKRGERRGKGSMWRRLRSVRKLRLDGFSG